jgi:hypothetical protein
MKFLDNYIFKTIAVVVFLFLTIPFVMPDRQPVAAAGEEEGYPEVLPVVKNPLAKVYDRISNFYGFGSGSGGVKKSSGLDLSGVSAGAYGAGQEFTGGPASRTGVHDSYDRDGAAAEVASASGSDGSSAGGLSSSSAGGKVSAGASSSAGPAPRRTSVAERSITFGGKKYDVLTDLYGKSYALTERGPVLVETLVAKGAIYKGGKNTVLADRGADAQAADGGSRGYAASLSSGNTGGGARFSARRGGSGGFGSGGLSGGADRGFDLESMGDSFAKAKAKVSASRGGSGGIPGGLSRSAGARTSQASAVNNTAGTGGTSVSTITRDPYLASSPTYAQMYSSALAESYSSQTYSIAVNNAGSVEAETAAPYFMLPSLAGKQVGKLSEHNAKSEDYVETSSVVAAKKNEVPDTNEEALVPIKKDETSANDPQVKQEKNKEINLPFLQSGDDNILPANPGVRKSLTEALIGPGVTLLSADETENPWVFPSKIDMNSDVGPGMDFYNVNGTIFEYSAGIELADVSKWKAADEIFKTQKKHIENITKGLPLSYVVIDGGTQGSSKFSTAAENSYHNKFAKILLGPTAKNIAQNNNVVDLKEFENLSFIAYVSDPKTGDYIKSKNKNAKTVTFYIPTPDSIGNAARDSAVVVNNFYAAGAQRPTSN